ncbi:hypothetical protein LTR84_007520 [Exophiala bonariae]|uniref:Tetrapyrrole biosynthesis uroporphyrinogen III synthase domain-containing protein n=1 Tax=Exophiala bonariae TaxID=1690606 RepID=A0AAV9NNZ2_9EURO|nr:hypothetical protein LTR84_007520 [Exophiala bonariae]
MSTPLLSSSSAPTLPPLASVPLFLLKTESQPHDSYLDHFSALQLPKTPGHPSHAHTQDASFSSDTAASSATPSFHPLFVPVLEHHPNIRNLDWLQDRLRSEELGQKYGGMIFTSQRAVEAWTEVVKRMKGQSETSEVDTDTFSKHVTGVSRPIQDHETPTKSHPTTTQQLSFDDPQGLVDGDFVFPLYSVGPATSRALNTLVVEISGQDPSSPFSRLRPSVLGEHTGNGANLAQYILSHYNSLHSRRLYTFYDAPRLPITPLIGPPGGERFDKEDKKLRKKALLFLVGEQRRDIIPRTLTDQEGKLAPNERIDVDEVEVYVTGIMESFQDDFSSHIDQVRQAGHSLAVVVVFSPQGCEAMLRALRYINEEGHLTALGKGRWQNTSPSMSGSDGKRQLSVVIATIGPTTRDHLKDQFGFDADVCASKPTPQGVSDGVLAFLHEKNLI